MAGSPLSDLVGTSTASVQKRAAQRYANESPQGQGRKRNNRQLREVQEGVELQRESGLKKRWSWCLDSDDSQRHRGVENDHDERSTLKVSASMSSKEMFKECPARTCVPILCSVLCRKQTTSMFRPLCNRSDALPGPWGALADGPVRHVTSRQRRDPKTQTVDRER
jgi:hypothetical protein